MATRPNGQGVPEPLRPLAKSVVEATLPNGLRVRLIPSPTVPVCSLYLFYGVGSRNEAPGMTGISHLFEHMMFNGSRRYGRGKFDRLLEANGGSSNAYTSTDMTVYHEDFMPGALDLVLDLEADRMQGLRIDARKLDEERKVVLEERRLRVENEVEGILDEELANLLYASHPYRWPVIGWNKDIETISATECETYYRQHYAPENAILYLAGDFHPEEAMKLIRRRFKSVRNGVNREPRSLELEPQQRGERRAVVEYPALAPSLLLGWRGSVARSEDALVLDVLQYALGTGQSSRLRRALIYEQPHAVSVSVDWGWRVEEGTFLISVQLGTEGNTRVVEEVIEKEIASIADQGLTESELLKVKRNLSYHFYRELTTNGGRAHALGNYEMLLGNWREGLALPDKYAAITSEQVREAAKRYLAPRARCVVTLKPLGEA